MKWLYKESKPDDEEYLLGRRIDNHVEALKEPEEPDPSECFTRYFNDELLDLNTCH